MSNIYYDFDLFERVNELEKKIFFNKKKTIY